MFITPNLEDVRQAILQDLQSLEPQADVNEDSDHYVRASVLAAVAEGIYAHQKWAIKQFFPDTADTDFLEKHARLRGVIRRNATTAEGVVAVLGKINSIIPPNTHIQAVDGRVFVTTSHTKLTHENYHPIPIRATEAGAKYNIPTPPVIGQFLAAPTGVQSDCVFQSAIGGTDAESDSSLLERLLEIIRRPPAGGNQYDYKNWALSVDGVDFAQVYPLRRGLGTVDIVITSANNVPSDEIVRRTQTYIDDVRPVTAIESKVIKPDVVTISFNIQVKLGDITLSDAKTAIQATLVHYFNGLVPGDELIISQCEAVVSDVIGIVDRRFISPTTNCKANTTTKMEWFRLGSVTVTEMT